MVTLPTGGGKSLLFQAPALFRSIYTNRLSIVITPLKALMKDQVDGLNAMGFFSNVDYLNSDKSYAEISQIYRRMNGGEMSLLYVTPERFRAKAFMNALITRMQVDNGLEYVVFDEAHCISQWGQDFRPEYLNTIKQCSMLQDDGGSISIAMYSATVTKQVYDDITHYVNNVTRLGETSEYNPIRDHIGIDFLNVEDGEAARSEAIVSQIEQLGLNHSISRTLIFARTRKECETYAAVIAQKLNRETAGISNMRVGYFHAGMDTEERDSSFERFKDGEVHILVATKAFGMGMDIPNIHHIIHISPPTFIEDYLQEVGRAGRKQSMYEAVGFSSENPIKATCLISNEDFKHLKDLLKLGMLSWDDISRVWEELKAYIAKFRSLEDAVKLPVAVSSNFWSKENSDDSTAFKLILYWLERLNRIKMGFFVADHIDLSIISNLNSSNPVFSNDQTLLNIYEYAQKLKAKQCVAEESEVFQIPVNEICSDLQISSATLFRNIIVAAKHKMLKLHSYLNFKLTKKRYAESYYGLYYDYTSVNVFFKALLSIMQDIPLRKEQYVDVNGAKRVVKSIIINQGLSSNEYMPWYKDGQNKADGGLILTKSWINDMVNKKAKHILSTIAIIPKVKFENKINTGSGEVKQIVYKYGEEWKHFIPKFESDCIATLKHLVRKSNENINKLNWTDIIIELGLNSDFLYFSRIINVLKLLGHIQYDNIFASGIEVYATDCTDAISPEPLDGIDSDVYKNFQYVAKMKEIKFICMDSFRDVDDDNTGEFIKRYFRCEHESDFMNLLADYNTKDNPRMQAFRAEAIKVQEDKLSEEQRVIYNDTLTQNINVIAGPGSGKTHILTLLCAKLIHKMNVRPENILVLAYNRAVVVELKNRLSKLFSDLGYGNAVRKVQIYTFHSLAKRYCGDLIKDKKFEEWESIFYNYLKENPGRFKSDSGNIKYIFIDEFQDITEDRLSIIDNLNKIYKPRFFTIGDINQSIYGFEKKAKGHTMDPRYYYQKLDELLHPKQMHMRTNFRSYQGILDTATQFCFDKSPNLLSKSIHEVSMPAENYVFDNLRTAWFKEFEQVVDHATNEGFNEIALFFRSNNEVYRGYQKLTELNMPNLQIRIQGTSGFEMYRLREIYAVISLLKQREETPLSIAAGDDIKQYIDSLRNGIWNTYYLDMIYAIVIDYLYSESFEGTYADLVDYIYDICGSDDGQLHKIYEKHKGIFDKSDKKLNIVLTTMHKVKGLEFDAVVTVPSFSNYPFNQNVKFSQEEIDEEKRLIYVAYTRAKKYLRIYKGLREDAVENNNTFDAEAIYSAKQIGYCMSIGIQNYYINYTAINYNTHAYIETSIKKGDPIILKRYYDQYQIYHNGVCVGQLSGSCKLCKVLQSNIIEGLFVNDIIVWTYEDSINADNNNNTNYAEKWSNEAKNRGYIYIVDIAGYSKGI